MLYRSRQNELAKEFDEPSIADLYIWLARRFPLTENKDLKDFQITGLLQGLLRELKQRGTEAAVAAVQRIAEALPDREWLKLAVQQADEQRLRNEWQGIEPAKLLEMAEGAR
jgi:vancomycin resistance protein YoaR